MDYQSNLSDADTARDAKNAALGAADAIKTAASDVAGQTQQSAIKLADQVQQAGMKAVDATRAYAKDAVDSAGRKVNDMKSQLDSAKASATDYIHDDPVRAVKMAAIGGGLLTALVLSLTRRGR